MLESIGLHLLDCSFSNATRGRVDDAQQADGILRAQQNFQIGKKVFDFGALVETETTNDQVLATVAAQRFFNLARLEIRAIQDGNAIEPGRETVALCRCGKSRIRPFCDGSHKLVRFTAPSGPERRS